MPRHLMPGAVTSGGVKSSCRHDTTQPRYRRGCSCLRCTYVTASGGHRILGRREAGRRWCRTRTLCRHPRRLRGKGRREAVAPATLCPRGPRQAGGDGAACGGLNSTDRLSDRGTEGTQRAFHRCAYGGAWPSKCELSRCHTPGTPRAALTPRVLPPHQTPPAHHPERSRPPASSC